MKANWTIWMVSVGLALALVGAGVAGAKPHGGGGHGKDAHKRGKHGEDGGARGGKGHGGGNQGNGPGSSACDGASSAIQAFVDASCPCDGIDDGGGVVPWKNHGQYVRCVSHAVRDAVRTAGVKRRCAKGIMPCAARSSCGKKNGVACVLATTGVCMDGTCTNDGVPCTTDAECASLACTITSAERCANAGGMGVSGSCCTAAASPSGAFLD